MLYRSARSWVFDFFVRRGWLARRHRRLRVRTESRPPIIAAECQCLEERVLLSTITVTSLADSLNAGNGVTLRDAIQAANTNTSVDGSVAGQSGVQDVIVFQAGLTGTVALTLGQLTISSSMVIQGLGASNTTIDAQQNSRIFNLTLFAGDVTLDGLTLENGRTTDNGAASLNAPPGTGEGGAIRSASAGRLTVSNSVVTGNSTTGDTAHGGAIFAAAGPVTVDSSTFSGNFTSGLAADGGAIAGNQSLTIRKSTFSGNLTSANSAQGGAIADLNLTLTVSDSTFSGNHTQGSNAGGGAILALGPSLVTNSTFSGNFTSGAGAHGGAIFASNSLTLTNGTLAGNSTQGGATGGIGGAIFAAGALTVSNSIVAQNTDNGTAPDLSEAGGTIRFSLIGNNKGTPLAAAPVGTPDANGNLVGTPAAPIDPLLGPLANNGGPTQTRAELAGSPAIDAGGNALAVDPVTGVVLANEQRGTPFLRITGAAVDMGAYEVQPRSMVFTGQYAREDSSGNVLSLASVTQNGNQLTLTGLTTATATITSATQLNVGGVTATYGDSRITFGASGSFANEIWVKLDLPIDYTNRAGAPVHIYQNGTALTFFDANGVATTGTWINPRRLFAYGQIVIIGTGASGGELLWNDGSIWRENVSLNGTSSGSGPVNISARPSQLTVVDYTNQLGASVHLIETGTTRVIFVDSLGRMSLGAFFNVNQATADLYPNDVATFSGGSIFWQDGYVWTPAASRSPQITLTDYTNQNGVSTHVIRNGTANVAFSDGLGRLSLGKFFNLSQALADAYPNDIATFSGNTVIWQDGFVWTGTSSPPITTTATDANGTISHLKLLSPTSLVGLDGALTGVTGTRLNGKINWSNGDVWDNFDFNLLNAFFEMGTTYP